MALSTTDQQFIKYLQKNCHAIDFFQMMRFLYRLVRKADGNPLKDISITPSFFAKRFSETQIVALHKTGHTHFELEYNEYAMYGTYSCLPEGLTARINQYEHYGYTEPKAFMDIFHSYLHHLSFRSQLANKTLIKLIEANELPKYTNLLHHLAGLSPDFFALDGEFAAWMQYRRMLTGKNKNGIGLQRLLEQFFLDRDISFHFTVGEGYMMRESAPDAKLHAVGNDSNMLGYSSYVGSVFQNTQACIRFHFTLDTLEQYYEFVYGDLIHTFVQLALAYCGVRYLFLFSFDDIIAPRDNRPLHTMAPQLGVSSMVYHDQTSATDAHNPEQQNSILLATHEFIYTETLGRERSNEVTEQTPLEQSA